MCSGDLFAGATIQSVWDKAIPFLKYVMLKRDIFGAIICRSDFGEPRPNGWEIDHIQPVAGGGTDELTNLQPLQWENNRRKGDRFPDCPPKDVGMNEGVSRKPPGIGCSP